MTKYKWSILGLIVSVILFLVLLISPLINFYYDINGITFPGKTLAERISMEAESSHPFLKFAKSFSTRGLPLIPIIVFSFMTLNYKKSK